MDKEILRIVIIVTGVVVVVVMLAWAYLKDKKAREDMEFYGDEDDYDDEAEEIDPRDDFDIIPLGVKSNVDAHHHASDKSARYYDEDDDEPYYEEEEEDEDEDDEVEQPPRAAAPEIIQFSIITKADEDFNGADLVEAFKMVGLEYGSLKIFERLDTNRLVDFGVACIVEPGTFPDKDLENFYCPGLVFFMQPEALDNAQAAFDDYIETIHLIAEKLDGVILDHRRQPLTNATIQAIRQSL